MLAATPPDDVQTINVNIPNDATPDMPWWLTRLSRQCCYLPLAPDRKNGRERPGYRLALSPERSELDSDVWAVRVDRIVAVTPLSLDLTSRVDFGRLHSCLRGELIDCLAAPEPTLLPAVGAGAAAVL
jgi:5'-nucleotidase